MQVRAVVGAAAGNAAGAIVGAAAGDAVGGEACIVGASVGDRFVGGGHA
jgi:hypothetical protein